MRKNLKKSRSISSTIPITNGSNKLRVIVMAAIEGLTEWIRYVRELKYANIVVLYL